MEARPARRTGQRSLRTCCALLAALALPAHAQRDWYATTEASYFVPDRELFEGSDVSLGIGAGLVLSRELRIEFSYHALKLIPENLPGLVEQNSAQIAGLYDYLRGKRWQAYVGLGLGASRTEIRGSDTTTLPFVTGSTGLSWALTDSQQVRLDAELRTRSSYDEDATLGRSRIRDSQFLLRLRYHFGGAVGGAVTVPDQVHPVAPDAPDAETRPAGDRDEDGIPDSRDYCPNTIPNVRVDADGCMARS